MHSFSITLWWAMLIFILFVLSTGNKVLANSLYIWMFDWHRFSRCSPFWFLNPLKYLLVQLWFFDHTLCELLHSGEGMFKLLGVKMLISSVSPSTYILITCLKCSKASFSLTSCSEKMRRRQCGIIAIAETKCALKNRLKSQILLQTMNLLQWPYL